MESRVRLDVWLDVACLFRTQASRAPRSGIWSFFNRDAPLVRRSLGLRSELSDQLGRGRSS